MQLGDVIQSEDTQVINVGVELDAPDSIVQRTVDAQMMGDDAYLNSNNDEVSQAALAPTLLGTIAEGIALSEI